MSASGLPEAGPPMEFKPRPEIIPLSQLEQKLRVCPTADAFRVGFVLPESNVDDILRAAKEVEDGQIYADPSFTLEQNLDTLVRTVRLLQCALEIQFKENDGLVNELNTVTQDLEDIEERERSLSEENDRLRDLRDKEQADGDVVELRKKNELLQSRLEEEERVRERRDRIREDDDRRIRDLEDSLKRADRDLARRNERLQEVEDRFSRLQDDHTDLRQTYEALRAEHAAYEAKGTIGDAIRQQGWKVEHMVKENRALELANSGLRKEIQEVKTENLEVSEKIVMLSEQARELKAKESEFEARMEMVVQEKADLLTLQEELRSEVAEKLGLLEEFETKFTRQYHSWEEERAGLMAQIDGLRRELKGDKPRRRSTRTLQALDDTEEDMNELRGALNEAKEREILLLEAYEQLEKDTGAEIDRALAKQRDEMQRLQRKAEFLQERLDDEKNQNEELRSNQADLEEDLMGQRIRNKEYEQAVYGLPQAVEEIHALKDALHKEEGRVRGLVQQINKLSVKVEDLADENTVLRRKAGVDEDATVDIKDIRMQKEAQIAQLRSLNALLERQVADLEEERRKLRMELKFRAKYHGQHALEMGLSPNQLLMVEEFVEGMKHGRNNDALLVDQLQQRIDFLQVRLSEVMAFADIPPSMRPILSEFDPVGSMLGLMGGVAGRVGSGGHLPAGMTAVRAARLEALKAVLLKSLSSLRAMDSMLAAKHNVGGNTDYRRMMDDVVKQLTDAVKEVDAMLADVTAAAGVKPQGGHAQGGNGGGRQLDLVDGDANFLADAVADELREKLRELARQCADLQVDVIKKDENIKSLLHQRDEMERKFGVPIKDRQSDYIPRVDFEDLGMENNSLKEQLVYCLEELASRERELAEMHESCNRHATKMQTFSDQVKMVYREYATALGSWKVEKRILEKRLKVTQEDADGYKASTGELQRGLDAVAGAHTTTDIQKEYINTVRRMALVQIKHAKIARELEASVMGEKAATERIEELEEEVRDIGSTCRARMRWLEATSDQASRRIEGLFRELEGSVPLPAYHMLVAKHVRLQSEVRRQVEDIGDSVMAMDEVMRLRDDMAELMVRYDRICDDNTALKEKQRQIGMLGGAPAGLSAASGPTAGSNYGNGGGGYPGISISTLGVGGNHPGGYGSSGQGNMTGYGGAGGGQGSYAGSRVNGVGSEVPISKPVDMKFLDSKLSQDLVAARVVQESTSRRMELVESERDRVAKSLQEAQARMREMEVRLGQSAGELDLCRSSATELERRLEGSKSKLEVDRLAGRLMEAEEAASKTHSNSASMAYRVEDAERKLQSVTRDRQRHLAEITNLRAALRDAMAKNDQAAIIGKLHLEVDHLRAKESLVRNALNRSELERIEIEKELRRLRSDSVRLNGRIVAHQDQARWAEKQRHEAHAQLDMSLAGRTEQWKAALYARKLEQLKTRNDAIADGLDLARRRIKKLEDMREEAEAKLGLSEDVEALLNKGVSEVVRDAARMQEGMMQLKVERGKLQREEVLMREKVHYVERVNAELHELLEKYEAEFFSNQLHLEGDKQAAYAQSRALQDELTRLQERLTHVLAGQGADTGDLNKPGSALRVSADAGKRLHGLMQNHTKSDREMMLKQIESLKAARQEAEHFRQESTRQANELSLLTAELNDVRRHHNDALARLKDQSESLMHALDSQRLKQHDETVVEQMKAVAEATINELKGRMRDRDLQILALMRTFEDGKKEWLAQHAHDRQEIERLNQRLFERNDASIDNLKGLLDRIPHGEGGEGWAELQQLRDMVDRKQDEINVLKNQLEQKDAAMEVLRNNYEMQLRKLEAEVSRLQAELDRPRDDAPSRALVAKLSTQLRARDASLLKLKEAVKALETRLGEKFRREVDDDINGASWKEQERLNDMIQALQDRERELMQQLQIARDEAAAGPAGERAADAVAEALRNQVNAAMERNAELEREFARVRLELQRLKNTEQTVVDLASGMTVEGRRQMEDLQRRINVLERQNQQLKRTIQQDSDATSTGVAPQAYRPPDSYDGDDGGGGGGLGRRPTTAPGPRGSARSAGGAGTSGRPQSSGGARGQPGDPAFDQAVAAAVVSALEQQQQAAAATQASRAAVSQWDEAKRLNGRIEEMRKKLAKKSEEMAEIQKNADKHKAMADRLQIEVDRQAAALRDASEKLKRAAAAAPCSSSSGRGGGTRGDASMLRQYVERCAELEQILDALQAEVARSKLSEKHAEAGPSDAVDKDAALFSLKLERDQAQATVTRLKARISQLFGADADATAALGAATSAGRSVAGAGGGRGATMGAREAELMSTINNLKVALEKATSASVPTTKYMAEVSKRKDVQKELAAASGEAAKLRSQSSTATRVMAELQATNAQLRAQLRSTQAAEAPRSDSGVGARLGSLEAMLTQRDEEVRNLRLALVDMEEHMQLQQQHGGADPAAGDAEAVMVAAQERMAELEEENRDLRNELNAFDPAFFEEIEDLKHEHHVLSQRVEEYEATISRQRVGSQQTRGASSSGEGGRPEGSILRRSSTSRN